MGHHGELSKDWNKLVTPDNLLPLAYGRRWSIHGGHERRPRWKFTAISRCAAAGTTSGTTWSLGVQFARQSDGPARAEAIFEPPTPGVVAGEGSGQAWSVRLHAAQPQGYHDVHAFFPAEVSCGPPALCQRPCRRRLVWRRAGKNPGNLWPLERLAT